MIYKLFTTYLMQNYLRIFLSISFFILTVWYQVALSQPPLDHIPIATIHIKGHEFKTWVAINETQYLNGLKQITAKQLKGKGMLFSYPNEFIPTFTMQGTLTDIDLLCLNDKGIVLQIMHMKKNETKLYTPMTPCRYALELEGGATIRYKIVPSDQVHINPPKDS